jgi:hypothetical protein
MAGNDLTGCKMVSISSKALLHGVSKKLLVSHLQGLQAVFPPHCRIVMVFSTSQLGWHWQHFRNSALWRSLPFLMPAVTSVTIPLQYFHYDYSIFVTYAVSEPDIAVQWVSPWSIFGSLNPQPNYPISVFHFLLQPLEARTETVSHIRPPTPPFTSTLATTLVGANGRYVK